MTTTKNPRQRLINLAVWAAGEQAKQELGLPSEWVQAAYLTNESGCGTACCIAGKVALQDGGVPALTDEAGRWITDRNELLQFWLDPANEGSDTSRVMFPGQDEPDYVRDYATEALGLTHWEAERLFYGYNGLADVLRVIGEILERMDGQK